MRKRSNKPPQPPGKGSIFWNHRPAIEGSSLFQKLGKKKMNIQDFFRWGLKNSPGFKPRRSEQQGIPFLTGVHFQPCRQGLSCAYRRLVSRFHMGTRSKAVRRLGAQRGSRKVSQHRQLSLNAPTRGWMEALHSNALGFSLPRPKRLSNASLCHFAWRRLKCMAIHVSELKLGIGLALATPSRVPNWPSSRCDTRS